MKKNETGSAAPEIDDVFVSGEEVITEDDFSADYTAMLVFERNAESNDALIEAKMPKDEIVEDSIAMLESNETSNEDVAAWLGRESYPDIISDGVLEAVILILKGKKGFPDALKLLDQEMVLDSQAKDYIQAASVELQKKNPDVRGLASDLLKMLSEDRRRGSRSYLRSWLSFGASKQMVDEYEKADRLGRAALFSRLSPYGYEKANEAARLEIASWPEGAFPSWPDPNIVDTRGALFLMYTYGSRHKAVAQPLIDFAGMEIWNRISRYAISVIKSSFPTYYANSEYRGDLENACMAMVYEKAEAYNPLYAPITYYNRYFMPAVRNEIAAICPGMSLTSHYVEAQKRIRRAQNILKQQGIEPTVDAIYLIDGALSRKAIADNLRMMETNVIASLDSEDAAEVAANTPTPDVAVIRKEEQAAAAKLIRSVFVLGYRYDAAGCFLGVPKFANEDAKKKYFRDLKFMYRIAVEISDRIDDDKKEKKEEICRKIKLVRRTRTEDGREIITPLLDVYNRLRKETQKLLQNAALSGDFGPDIKAQYGKALSNGGGYIDFGSSDFRSVANTEVSRSELTSAHLDGSKLVSTVPTATSGYVPMGSSEGVKRIIRQETRENYLKRKEREAQDTVR